MTLALHHRFTPSPDLSLVPIGDLPLQTILHFSPPLPEVATPYLQSLCLAEGYSLQPEDITRIHLNSWKYSTKDFSTYPPSTGDLRRTINALQVACLTLNVTRPEAQWTSEPTPRDVDDARDEIASTFSDQRVDNTARISAKAIEAKSYIDGVLCGDSPQLFASRDLASHLPSEDDEIGHVILRDVHTQDPAELGLSDRHEEMVSTAIQLSRGQFDVDAMISLEETRRRVGDGRKFVLHEVCPPAIWSRADDLVEMEYMGYIGQIVEAEDKEEKEQERRRQGGRNTRNSARSGYVRTLGLSEEARRVLQRECSVDRFT
ncbi:hypothetical protein M413DRAFT_441254 [Hebeloma cylindrosporum]|uniref:Uncharacterized protein n=1 Tax=Hebeloma cylindrosporum TaxID=76867 RepID=A0A0C2Y8N3_HEBCY|nr:hypothetical protein M413DRAFT_441254 [Hebeloma cylindrosporum h7]